MFNISDSAVVISAIAMVVLSVRGVEYRTPDSSDGDAKQEQS
jgi:hypothetical protein